MYHDCSYDLASAMECVKNVPPLSSLVIVEYYSSSPNKIRELQTIDFDTYNAFRRAAERE